MRTVADYLADRGTVEDDPDLLRDQERFRVPMLAMDAMDSRQRRAEDRTARQFGLDSAADLQKPGPRYRAPAQEAAIDEIYRLHDEAESTAWQRGGQRDDGPNNVTGFGERPFITAQPGMPCMTNSREMGILRDTPNGLVCVPIRPSPTRGVEPRRDSTDALNAVEAAYRDYDNYMTNAWRGN
jgi:hypothetical protein